MPMTCACERENGRVVAFCAAHHQALRNAVARAIQDELSGEQPIPEKDLLAVDVPLPTAPTEMPKPTCPKCGGEIPFFYFYVYKLQSTRSTMVFQASCCPHANCRAICMVLPIGEEASSIATPGQSSWPGMPEN